MLAYGLKVGADTERNVVLEIYYRKKVLGNFNRLWKNLFKFVSLSKKFLLSACIDLCRFVNFFPLSVYLDQSSLCCLNAIFLSVYPMNNPMSPQPNFPLSVFPPDQKSFLFASTASRFPPLTFLHRRIKHPITNHFKEAHETAHTLGRRVLCHAVCGGD